MTVSPPITPAAAAVTGPAVTGQTVGGGFVALPPARILDTRQGLTGPVGAGQTIDVAVPGQGGVPLVGVAAVALNLTVTEPSMESYVTAYPAGTVRPVASNLNVVAGQTVANAVVVKLGSAGRFSLYNERGAAHLIADVTGYYTDTADTGDRYRGQSPVRVLDTRSASAIGPGGTIQVDVTSGLPPGVTAVAVNVTVTRPTSSGYLTVFPAGQERPLASSLNFTPGDTRANFVAAALGAQGLDIYNSAGTIDVVVDRLGYWTPQANSRLTPLQPTRVLDTRLGVGAPTAPLGAGRSLDLSLAGIAGVPPTGAAAVVLNVTTTQPTAASYLTVYPQGAARPLASSLNMVAGQTVANLVVAALDPAGRVTIYNNAGSTHVIADVVGWFDRPVWTFPTDGVNGTFEYVRNAVNAADVVIDPASTYAYISNPAHDRVEVLRLADGRFEAPIPVGPVPAGLDLDASGKLLYVANRGSDSVSVVHVAQRRELRRITLPQPTYGNSPYSIAVLANNHALLITTFSGSGYGANLFDIDLTSNAIRSVFGTTERAVIRASGDRRSAAIAIGDVSNGPVGRYDSATGAFTMNETGAFVGHVATNQNGSVIVANPGAYVFDAQVQPIGPPDNSRKCSGSGVVLNPAGTRLYSLADGYVAVCDGLPFTRTDTVWTFDRADWYGYLNNHRLARSPDGTTLVGLTAGGVTMLRI